MGMLLETWVLGAILAMVGLLLITCSFGYGEYGLILPFAGIVSTGAGSLVFVAGFKKWIESL
jgi:hypothetical protein